MTKADELYVAQKAIFDNEYDLNVSTEPKMVTLEKVKFNSKTGGWEDVTRPNMAWKENEFKKWKTEFEKKHLDIQVAASGYTSGTPSYISIGGVRRLNVARSYGLVVFDTVTLSLIFAGNFDVYGNSENAKTMAKKIDEYMNKNYLFVVSTNDEPNAHHKTPELLEAMKKLKANKFQNDFPSRGAYVLVVKDGRGRIFEDATSFGGDARASIYFNQYIKV